MLSSQKRAVAVLRQHAGFAQTRDFEQAGVGRWVLPDLVRAGVIERVRHGFYRLPDVPALDHRDMVEACAMVPHGVVFLLSALSYYDLTTYNPWRVSLAVGSKAKVVLPQSPPIELHYLKSQYHELGAVVLELPAGRIRIYDREKTVCDCLRYRNRIGLDITLEGLKNYLKSPYRNIDKLLRYAGQCRIEHILLRYLEAML
ncbi:MAG: Abortive infection protein AbiEi [Firmicutes bacterium]|nr:Abortive infection protein AbiEi [Bacillota bacterium]